MRKPLIMSLAAALVAAFTFVSARAADDTAAPATAIPAVGQVAPTFVLPAQDGKPIALSQYKGKWVVLYFYPKDMTQGCTIEAHKFQDSLSQFEAKHAVILGVSVDSTDSHKQFCAKDGLTFHLLSDPGHKVVELYGSLGKFGDMVIANRNTFLIDPKGVIKQEWVKVNPADAASEVLAAIP